MAFGAARLWLAGFPRLQRRGEPRFPRLRTAAGRCELTATDRSYRLAGTCPLRISPGGVSWKVRAWKRRCRPMPMEAFLRASSSVSTPLKKPDSHRKLGAACSLQPLQLVVDGKATAALDVCLVFVPEFGGESGQHRSNLGPLLVDPNNRASRWYRCSLAHWDHLKLKNGPETGFRENNFQETICRESPRTVGHAEEHVLSANPNAWFLRGPVAPLNPTEANRFDAVLLHGPNSTRSVLKRAASAPAATRTRDNHHQARTAQPPQAVVDPRNAGAESPTLSH